MSAMYSTVAWAKASPEAKFEKIRIERNVAGDEDVTFDVKYCGICHTDVHIAGNDMVGGWGRMICLTDCKLKILFCLIITPGYSLEAYLAKSWKF